VTIWSIFYDYLIIVRMSYVMVPII